MPSGVYIHKKNSRPNYHISLETIEKIKKTLTGKMRGEKHWSYKTEHRKVKVICDNCGEEVEKVPSQVGKHNFCNNKCRGEWAFKNRRGENSPHFGKHHSEETKEKIREKRKLQEPPMLGKHHSNRTRERIGSKFIGRRLSKETIEKIRAEAIGEKNSNWNNGSSFEPYTSEFNNKLKEQVRKRDTYKCQLCGCLEIESDRLLDVHHIDHNKENCSFKNLIALCRRCNGRVNSKSKREYYEKFFNKLIETKLNK